MESQPGVVQPQNFPWRNLTTRPESNGQILNPVGYGDFGGASGPSIWNKSSILTKPETGSSAKSASGHLKGK